MKRYLKLIGIPFIIAVGIFLIIKFTLLKKLEFKDIVVEEYVTVYNSNEEAVVFVTADDAIKAAEFSSILESSFANKNIKKHKINLTKLSGEELQQFIDVSELTDNEYTVPMLIYIKAGKIVDSIEGYAPKTNVLSFISKNNIE